jgi:hypothetical protein
MPIQYTKYNYPTKLQKVLSNSSTLPDSKHNYFFTCDLSDTLLDPDGSKNIINQNKTYLNSKASYLIHPFSKVSNCTTKLNNQKKIYQSLSEELLKKRYSIDLSKTSSLPKEATQKIIQNQRRVTSSLYSMNLGSLYIGNDLSNNLNRNKFNASDRATPHGIKHPISNTSLKANYGVDIKHNSYNRYLGRKKSCYLKTENRSSTPPIPEKGNKNIKFGLISGCN